MTGEGTKYYELLDGVDFAQSLFSTMMQVSLPLFWVVVFALSLYFLLSFFFFFWCVGGGGREEGGCFFFVVV